MVPNADQAKPELRAAVGQARGGTITSPYSAVSPSVQVPAQLGSAEYDDSQSGFARAEESIMLLYPRD